MAKAATLDAPAGMGKAEIKHHLRLARSAPVQVAFAIAKNGNAILQFDRRKPGRALDKELKDAAPDSKSHRWGTAMADPANDKILRLTVNQPGGGLAGKLIAAIKGSGFSKVKLVLDDGTEVESHEEADEDSDAAEAGAAAGTAAAKAPPEPPAAESGGFGAALGGLGGVAPAAPQPDLAELQTELTGLVKRMLVVIARDPSQKAALTELAVDTRASLKRPDLTEASAAVDVFREAIGDAEQAAAAPQAPGSQAPAPSPAAPSRPTPAPPPPAAKEHHQQAAAQPDPGADVRKQGEAILATLTNAIKQAMPTLSLVPGLGEIIKTLVPAVQDAIKAGQIEQARARVDALLKQIAAAHPAQTAAPHPDAQHQHREHAAKHAPAISKASSVWDATRQKIMSELGKLEKSFADALAGHGMAADLAKTLHGKIDGTLHQLDDRLVQTLAAVNQAPDPAARAKHVEQAHKLVQHYQAHIAQDPVIKMLDRNPFSPIAIEKTVIASLVALQKSIR
jgi:hypothetical protein